MKRLTLLLLLLSAALSARAAEDNNPCLHEEREVKEFVSCTASPKVSGKTVYLYTPPGSVDIHDAMLSSVDFSITKGYILYRCKKCNAPDKDPCDIDIWLRSGTGVVNSPGVYSGTVEASCKTHKNTFSATGKVTVVNACSICRREVCVCPKCPICQKPYPQCTLCNICGEHDRPCCTTCKKPLAECGKCSICGKHNDKCSRCGLCSCQCNCGGSGGGDDGGGDDGGDDCSHHSSTNCELTFENESETHFFTGETLAELKAFAVSLPILQEKCSLTSHACSSCGRLESTAVHNHCYLPQLVVGMKAVVCKYCETDEQLNDFFTTGFVNITMRAICECGGYKDNVQENGYGSYNHFYLNIIRPKLDLDIDSDNDNGNDLPSRNETEDTTENKFNQPGKILIVNDWDTDNDGRPDFADGYDSLLFGNNGSQAEDGVSNQFIPIVLEIPHADKNTKVKVKFTYSASDPDQVRAGRDGQSGRITYEAAEDGFLRIWTKNGDQKRCKDVINQSGTGNYIPSDVAIPFNYISPNSNRVVLYVEAVKAGTGEIKIEFAEAGLIGVPDSTDTVKVTAMNLNIGVDGNRDGVIDFHNGADKSLLFWVNDDNDVSAINPITFQRDEDDGEQSGNSPTRDCDDDRIGDHDKCFRDLEDFAKLHISISRAQMDRLRGDLKLYVKLNSGKINLFKAEMEGLAAIDDFVYLRNTTIAQMQMDALKFMTLEGGATEQEIPLDGFSTDTIGFLLEGCEVGQGQLSIVLKYKGIALAERFIKLDMQKIEYFYDFLEVDENGNMTTRWSAYTPASQDYLLYVHGWNMKGWEKKRWTETTFKRLWHQGYKGRVGGFSWPTEESLVDSEGLKISYNHSEAKAWASAEYLAFYIMDLHQKKWRITAMAHSMGNIVTSEALRQLPSGTSIHAYISAQAAVPGRCYADKSILSQETCSQTLPDYYGEYHERGELPGTPGKPYFADMVNKTSKRIRFYNSKDWALGHWDTNNSMKPGLLVGNNYDYDDTPDGPVFYSKSSWPTPNLVLPFYEHQNTIFAYVVRSRTRAIGAETVEVPLFNKHYNLFGWDYDDAHYSHSRQFRSNIVDEWPYWKAVIESCEFVTTKTIP